MRTFNAAVKREGWQGDDYTLESGMCSYMWLRKTKKGYKKSDINDLKAELFTVGEW